MSRLLIARSALTFEGNLPQAYELWKADFETGDTSQFTGAGVGGLVVPRDGQAYQGLYYARAPLVNGSASNFGDFHDYGTPGTLVSQIRSFWAQMRVAYDAFNGNVGGDIQKLFVFQFYDSTWASGSFADANKKFQIILGVAGQSQARHREFTVRLVEYANQSGGAIVQSTFLPQNTLSVRPTIGPWDTLRMEVVLDSNGTSTLGIGQGNGILRVWCNNTLIVEYTNVNFVRGNSVVGIGRLQLTSEVMGGVWVGSNTHVYWDNIQLATHVSKLDPMPNAPVARGGDLANSCRRILAGARPISPKLFFEYFGFMCRPITTATGSSEPPPPDPGISGTYIAWDEASGTYRSFANDITIFAAVTAQGSGNGSSEANAMTLQSALAAAGPDDNIGVMPGVYTKASTSSKFHAAWRLTNSGTAGHPIRVIAKYSAIDLAGKTAGQQWTTTNLDTVFAHANRSELRHTGGAGGGTGGPVFGSSFSPVDAYQEWNGFCADEANAIPLQDSGPAVLWACNNCKIARSVLRGRDRSTTWGSDNHCGVRVEDWTGTAEVLDCVIHGFRTAGGSNAGHNHCGIERYSHGNQSGFKAYHNYIFGCWDGIFAKDEPFPDGNAQSEEYRYNIFDDNIVGIEMATQNMNGASTQSYCEYNLFTGSTLARVAFDGQQGNGNNIHIRYNTAYILGGNAGTGAVADMDFFGVGCELVGNVLVNTSGTAMYDANFRTAAIVPANYNCYFATGGGFTCRYNGSSYSSLTAWRGAPGNPDQNSINTNPLFVNAAGYDFEYQASSPCRTAAQDGGMIGYPRGGRKPGPRYAT